MSDSYSVTQVRGNYIAQTPPLGDQSNRIATTDFVQAAVAGGNTLVGDVDYQILTTDRVINQAVLFTGAHTWTMPPVSSVKAGQVIRFIGVCNGANLTLACQGSDLFYQENDSTAPSSITFTNVVSFDATALTNNIAGLTFWCISYFAYPEWTFYTPSFSPQSGSFNTASAGGRYMLLGSICHFFVQLIITDIGTGSGFLIFSLPVAYNTSTQFAFVGRETQAFGYTVVGNGDGTNLAAFVKYDGSAPGASNTEFLISGTFEVA